MKVEFKRIKADSWVTAVMVMTVKMADISTKIYTLNQAEKSCIKFK